MINEQIAKKVDEALGGLKDSMLKYSFKKHSREIELTTVDELKPITKVGVDHLIKQGFEFSMTYYDFNTKRIVMTFNYEKVKTEGLGALF